MTLIFVSFLALLLVVGLMAIGVILGRTPIAGSCGGVGAALGEQNYECTLCGGNTAQCARKKSPQTNDPAST